MINNTVYTKLFIYVQNKFPDKDAKLTSTLLAQYYQNLLLRAEDRQKGQFIYILAIAVFAALYIVHPNILKLCSLMLAAGINGYLYYYNHIVQRLLKKNKNQFNIDEYALAIKNEKKLYSPVLLFMILCLGGLTSFGIFYDNFLNATAMAIMMVTVAILLKYLFIDGQQSEAKKIADLLSEIKN